MKILINAKVLQQMLAEQPELEIQLVNSASAQVAEAFKKKVNTSSMVAEMIRNLEEQLSYRSTPLPALIVRWVEHETDRVLNAKLEAMTGDLIKVAVKKSMDDHKIWIQNNLNGIIIDKVNIALRAAQEAAIKVAFR